MNIYALSSGRGPSGIAIIRLSGKDALKISKIILNKKNINEKQINLCKFYDPSDNSLIDEGLLLLFPSPNSFIQGMIENEFQIPLLTVNSEELTVINSNYSFMSV